MRILEANSAVLTNVEVYTFLSDQAKQYHAEKRKGPGNLEMLRGEMLKYFETYPGPLSQRPMPYDVSAIPVLLSKLREFKISKGECIMLINLRPNRFSELNAALEEMTTRFDDDQQQRILDIVIETLGNFPPEADDEGAGLDASDS